MTGILPTLLLCAATVHPDTIQDIAKVESGFNPYAIAEITKNGGVVSHLPGTKEEAVTILKKLEADKKRYSVGLMQIYKGNFKAFGVSAEDMLDSCKNLKVFEKIITDCYVRGGDLPNALSCYYSGNFITGHKKEKTFKNTSYVERIGYTNKKYAVPSTKIDKGEVEEETELKNFEDEYLANFGNDDMSDEQPFIEVKKNKEIKKPKEKIIYPNGVLKSAFIENTRPTKIIGY